MLTALLVIFLLSIALALLGASLQLRMRLVRQEAGTVILSALSDAAVAEAVANLSYSSGYSGSPPHDFSEGKIGSEVRQVGLYLYEVTATASYGDRERQVWVRVSRPPGQTARVILWRRLPG